MRYLILLYGDPEAEAALAPEERRAIVEQHINFSTGLRKRGALVDGDALAPSTRVVRDGLVTDGPFAETKEQLGGYYLVECADLEEATELARQVPRSPGLVAEIRQLAGVGG